MVCVVSFCVWLFRLVVMSLVGFDVCFGWVCFVVGAGMLVPVPNGCFEGLGHLIIVVKRGLVVVIVTSLGTCSGHTTLHTSNSPSAQLLNDKPVLL